MDESKRELRLSYQPWLLVFVFVISGICLDHFTTLSIAIWVLPVSTLPLIWFATWRRRYLTTASLLVLLFAISIGGLWHHVRWNYFDSADISLFADPVPRPVVVKGTLTSEPRWIAAPSHDKFNPVPHGTRTRFTVNVESIRNGQSWRDASGDCDVVVAGQTAGLAEGDRVRIIARIHKTSEPTNPGEFDFREFYRGKRKLCQLRCNFPDCISAEPDHSTLPSWMRSTGIRKQLNQVIWAHVSPENAPLAAAILLGNREQLTSDQKESFLATGTIHLLAISGLHVGILAGGLLSFVSLGFVSRRKGLLLTMLVVVGYAWLVEFRPPVLRATILVVSYCISKWSGRRGFSLNTLALAALFVIVLNPADLFQAGAQLSFLAVATIMFCRRWIDPAESDDTLQRLIRRTRPLPIRFMRWVYRKTWNVGVMCACVWLIAAPLVASKFHIVAPISVAVNPLLIIPITFALFSGFGVLLFGWLIPPLGNICGNICDQSLGMIQSSVSRAESIPMGHFWTCGPGHLAIFTFYVLVFFALAFPPTRMRLPWAATLAVFWIAIAWLTPITVHQTHLRSNTSLQCTFINVGHGSSVLIELPGGKTILYDAGSFGRPNTCVQKILAVLWSRGIKHLDSIIVSHADTDHYNAIPELCRRISVGQVFVSPQMRDHRSPIVAEFFAELDAGGTSVDTLTQSDRVVASRSCSIRVVMPNENIKRASDNADSIVLEIKFASRTILLTGDTEKIGQAELLAIDLGTVDILQAPHHGSRHSRPESILAWCRPRNVVICDGLEDSTVRQVARYENGENKVFHTGRDGAIQFRIDTEGLIQTRSWKHDPW